MDQKPYCRTCILETNELIGVHGEIGRSYCMEDIIKKHFGILINSTDKISTKVCTVCWNKVDSFHGFYNQVLAAQTLLNDNNLSILEEDNKEDVRSLIGYENSLNILDGKLKRECNKEESVADLSGTTEDALQEITSLDEEVKREHKDNEHESDLESNYSSDKSWVSEPKKTKIARKTCRKSRPRRTVNVNTDGLGKCSPSGLKTNTPHVEEKIRKRVKKRSRINHCDDNDSLTQTERQLENVRTIEAFYKLQCDICVQPLPNFNELREHFERNHPDIRRYLMCCERKFIKRTDMADHAKWHTDPDKFRCPVCNKNKTFSSTKTLNNHMLIHAPADTKSRFTCEQCGKSFVERSKLNYHKLSHLPPEERKFKCEECDKSYGSIGLLNNHIKISHEKVCTHMCEICAKQFKSQSLYDRHVKIEHEGYVQPRVQCTQCHATLKDRGCLRRHMRIHADEGKVYDCDICGKTGPSLHSIKAHKKFVHFSETKFQCNLCDKAFKRALTLKEHMTTHTGERLYNCTFCTKTFNSNANMWSHRKKMHPAEWAEEQRNKFLAQYEQTSVK